ncbi:DMT family transporter [Candidatus Kuenenbacteria bacterium]|nr:DMT family transporter [Candidatus Kuenenbacteria bacterium]
MGVLFALLAMFSWGLGDFLIQRSTRRLGTVKKRLGAIFSLQNNDKYSIWIVLFYICGSGALVLTPFVWGEIGRIEINDLWLLFAVGLIMLVAALLDFKALKIGKISVVEPVFALEIPVVLILASLFLGEFLRPSQYFLIIILAVGIIFVSIKDLVKIKSFIFERGVGLAVVATVGMGLADFFVGLGARASGPLMVNWFLNLVVAIATLVYLLKSRKMEITWRYAKENGELIFFTCFFDNLAWIFFAFSMVYIPIAVATGISESYIAMASILGFVYNKERLKKHQWLGLVLTVISAVVLSLITA